jgi:hypothetical protein
MATGRHMGHRDRRSASLEDLSALYQAKKMESICHSVDSDIIYLLISDPEATELVTINEIHFIVDAIPSRRGRVRRTRDMTELSVGLELRFRSRLLVQTLRYDVDMIQKAAKIMGNF